MAELVGKTRFGQLFSQLLESIEVTRRPRNEKPLFISGSQCQVFQRLLPLPNPRTDNPDGVMLVTEDGHVQKLSEAESCRQIADERCVAKPKAYQDRRRGERLLWLLLP